ncbi:MULTISPECIES: proline racemase family protein [Burkholderia]|uniref:Proline racemase n=1 Tax=Burkholderia anthina TaxID=179879 RepID=A0A6P2G627_9BURK|nr:MULTISPECIES: proline racemase family protein [Burkholderia]AXK67875.1 proline racemase [Burkholderia sp. IDO3]MBM2766377.1 proline racemase family protein [Burkholderia anthina]PCD60808.1 proline racemase [Burkholderia sp. IDO3]QTD94990.1 proline racemase family protein [Burkholderia anthina]VVU48749.1 proline racemase [Burkholderia anthina]
MRWKKTLQLLDVHCEGEVGKVITSGVYDIPGETMMAKMDYINKENDSLRRFVCLEPRGAVNQTVNLMVPPCDPTADAGFIVLQADEAHPMSGANTMCVATALLETGMIEMQEPVTTLRLEAPAGIVTATAECRDGKCERVSLDMIPAFVEALDQVVHTDEYGEVKLDIAFGGVFYAVVFVEQLGIEITPQYTEQLVKAGMVIKRAANERFKVRHPLVPSIDHIAYAIFAERQSDGSVRTCCTLWPGRVDRSPCGTGSSAITSVLHARGELAVGEKFITRSIIGSEFSVELKGETVVSGKPAVLPNVSGRCWTYGISQLALDPDDPFARGFALQDAWGAEAIHIK